MAGLDWIKVIFRTLHFKRNLISSTSNGDLYFVASVDGQRVGDPSKVTHIKPNGVITLNGFDLLYNVSGKTWLNVKFQVKDKRTFVSDDDLGSLTYQLKFPYGERNYTSTNQNWILDWGVELNIDGTFGHHQPNEIFACRSGNGFLSVNTVAGTALTSRLEIDPVRPTPPDANLPPRPIFPAGTSVAKTNGAAQGNILPADPINIIPNPCVIPIIANAAATAATVAKIEFSYYRPDTLAFTDKDPRLKWSATPITAGAAVRFLDAPAGLKVQVYGVAAGEVLLQVRLRNQIFATYRALVGDVKKIPCRFNICNGPNAQSQPRATPQNVADHLAIANRFLRQMAVELVADTNNTVKDGATTTTIPGIFRIRVAAALTRNVPLVGFLKSVELNYRPGVMNFAYIHSSAPPDPTKPNLTVLGAASDYPANPSGLTITDSGTPSTSWNVPSGIKPDAAAAAVTMNLLAVRQRAAPAGVVGMYVCDSNGDPANIVDQQAYAGTVAHEFGHNLNLAHRVDTPGTGYDDGVSHPPGENVMHWANPTSIAQDFDIIQAKAARQSLLIPP